MQSTWEDIANQGLKQPHVPDVGSRRLSSVDKPAASIRFSGTFLSKILRRLNLSHTKPPRSLVEEGSTVPTKLTDDLLTLVRQGARRGSTEGR